MRCLPVVLLALVLVPSALATPPGASDSDCGLQAGPVGFNCARATVTRQDIVCRPVAGAFECRAYCSAEVVTSNWTGHYSFDVWHRCTTYAAPYPSCGRNEAVGFPIPATGNRRFTYDCATDPIRIEPGACLSVSSNLDATRWRSYPGFAPHDLHARPPVHTECLPAAWTP